MRVIRPWRNAIARLRQQGLAATTRYAVERLSESYFEWRLGVHTSGKRQPAEVGISSPDAAHYYPTDYRSILRAFRHLAVRPHADVFLDFGAGMGRVVVVAATRPFRRVVGVELSPELCAIARANVDRARGHFRCREVEIVTADAATYAIPDDVTVIFFYNPFFGPTLKAAFAEIRASLDRNPRQVTVVYKNTGRLSPDLDVDSWLARRHVLRACDAGHDMVIFESKP